jgi:hypothetical protein
MMTERAGGTKKDEGQPLYVPVVVHIVFNTPEQNISDEQIYSQLQALNHDFNRTNPDSVQTIPAFSSVTAHCNIRFLLTSYDESGNPSSGIVRIQTQHGPFSNADIHFTNRGGSDAWNTERFFNIWVADLADGVFGFSTHPNLSPGEDGIVIDYSYFGTVGTVATPYDRGRTTTHEAGHWLGLKHLWGDAGACITDDGIDDTPTQSGPSVACDLNRLSCGNLNMVQNFMDLSDDRCMNFFTRGQRAVMRQSLLTQRQELLQSGELITSTDSRKAADAEPVIIEIIHSGLLRITSSEMILQGKIYNSVGMEIASIDLDEPAKQTLLAFASVTGVIFVNILTDKARNTQRILVFP